VLENDQDEELLVSSLWVLHYIIGSSLETLNHVQRLIVQEHQICTNIAGFVQGTSLAHQVVACSIIGSLAYHCEAFSDLIGLDTLVPSLQFMMKESPRRGLRNRAVMALSGIVTGSVRVAAFLIESGVFQDVIDRLNTYEGLNLEYLELVKFIDNACALKCPEIATNLVLLGVITLLEPFLNEQYKNTWPFICSIIESIFASQPDLLQTYLHYHQSSSAISSLEIILTSPVMLQHTEEMLSKLSVKTPPHI
jgi:hypothetical protein